MSDHILKSIPGNPTDMTSQDLLSYGLGQVAYVRTMKVLHKTLWAVHAADGTPLSVFDDEQAALAALAQNDLDPVRLQ